MSTGTNEENEQKEDKKEEKEDKKEEAKKVQLSHPNCWYLLLPQIPQDHCMTNTVFEEIWALHPPEQGTFKIYGKTIPIPRYETGYNVDYTFSKQKHKAVPIPHVFIQKLLEWVQWHSGKAYFPVWMNWYVHGGHYIGLHADSERQIVPDSDIYSFSFGAQRDFVIQDRKGPKVFKKIVSLPDNSLIIMGGSFQSFYKHCLPKRKRIKTRRINITFRLFK